MNAQAVSTVRRLTDADIPAVAGVFSRVFLHRTGPVPSGLEEYLRAMYLTAPWAAQDIGPLVHQRADGEISGFIGVVPLPLRWGDKTLRAAVCSALMVDAHETDPMAGARLLRSFLAGPQDVSICETASDVSLGMWRRLKGIAMPQHSLNYLRIIRPLGYIAAELSRRSRLAAPLATIARPIDSWLRRKVPDGALRWWAFNSTADERLIVEPVAPAALIDLLPGFMADYAIRPEWSRRSLEHILDEVPHKPLFGELTARLVRTATGTPIGAFLYHAKPHGIGRVTQVFATQKNMPVVLDRMFAHAADAGLVALVGRTEPHIMDALLGRRTILFHSVTSGAHSRNAELIAAIERGELYFNGIVGESWSRLIGDDFRHLTA